MAKTPDWPGAPPSLDSIIPSFTFHPSHSLLSLPPHLPGSFIFQIPLLKWNDTQLYYDSESVAQLIQKLGVCESLVTGMISAIHANAPFRFVCFTYSVGPSGYFLDGSQYAVQAGPA